MSFQNPLPAGIRQVVPDYVSDGTTTVYGFPFRLWQAQDLWVGVGPGTVANEAGDPGFTQLTLNVDYTVTINGDTSANVTLTTAQAAGKIIRLQGLRIPSRTTSVVNDGVLQSVPFESELDCVEATLQEVRRDVSQEAARAESVEANLLADINNEVTRATAAEGVLSAEIAALVIAANSAPLTLLRIAVPVYQAGDPDDTASILRAESTCQGYGGGTLFLPPKGSPYLTSSTIALGNGVTLQGVKGRSLGGFDVPPATWAQTGSWIQPSHPTQSAVVMQGNGSAVSSVNFVHAQPVPGGSFVPNTYGWCIECNADMARIDNVTIVNATHGVLINYSSASGATLQSTAANTASTGGGGTGVFIENLTISAFVMGMRTTMVNDIITIVNVSFRGLYYMDNAAVLAYIRANAIGNYWGYTDNPFISNIQYLYLGRSWYCADETCEGNTHSLYQFTANNIQFLLCTISIGLAATTTNFVGQISGCLAQAGNAFGVTWADTMFQLGSDNVDLTISNLRVPDTGGSVAQIGAGLGGSLEIIGMSVQEYSTVSAGQTGFIVNAGAQLRYSNTQVSKPGGAGLRFAGAGLEDIFTDNYGSALQQQSTIVGTGAYQALTSDCLLRPGQMRAHACRVVGTVTVSVALAASTFSVQLTGLTATALLIASLSSAATGVLNVDSGWTEIAQADLNALAPFGHIQINPATGVTLSVSLQLIFR